MHKGDKTLRFLLFTKEYLTFDTVFDVIYTGFLMAWPIMERLSRLCRCLDDVPPLIVVEGGIV